MRRFIKEYFRFTSSELRIIIILSAGIFAAFMVRFLFPSSEPVQLSLSSADQAWVDSFILSLEKIEYEKKPGPGKREKTELKWIPREFDPNQVSLGELQEMGFPDYTGKNLVRYRKAGGIFRNKEDIKKIYGFSDSLYKKCESYIIIENPDTFLKVKTNPVLETFEKLAELNSSDSAGLLKIRGIGPYYAGKIIRYRQKLGGYMNTGQLMEIGGMDEEKLGKIEKQLSVDTTLVQKINLNTASQAELEGHPYISRRTALMLLKYREFKGGIKSAAELMDNNVISNGEYLKVRPYISF